MSLDQETINAQLELLAAHRRTLAHLITQQAQFSAGHIPAHIANGIAEARVNIARIKTTLIDSGVQAANEPNDETTPSIEPIQRARDDVLSGDKLVGDKIVGDK